MGTVAAATMNKGGMMRLAQRSKNRPILGAGIIFSQDNGRDQISADDEKDIDADKSAIESDRSRMEKNNW